ncbi:hypothetical protein SAMN04490247_2576 [Salimicrobium halophilum]|uniref:Uncharacterized protein n=1 Tax=Salimicrobium halophilum TaxID=86666 RepID=A0A1G8VBD9_9BACI|nr:hypothetical protein SAMN04490247_2576 [Salimicrobium halophilum]
MILQREPWTVRKGMNHLPNQASEHHIGTFEGMV